ncbi:MAG TPA: hypothetical protein VEA99_18645, partial [Gemmatimonadaceae bacterium]|nr:hypothetical protein [Gemmatimonadaceae bacterium]
FRFRNAILRAGIGQEIPIDSGATRLRLQLGMALHSINYALRQHDHVTDRTRRQRESWTEWTRTWGLGLHFASLELRYVGLQTTGTGRPGIPSGEVFFATPDAALATGGRNILSAPSGPLTLTGVRMMTHQVSVSLPLR